MEKRPGPDSDRPMDKKQLQDILNRLEELEKFKNNLQEAGAALLLEMKKVKEG